jgi:DNA primase
MGTMLTSYHIKLLQNIGELKNVILSYDNDRAGTEANIRNGKMLVESGFNVSVIAKYEDKYKDVDELINACSIEALTNVVEKRIDFISYLIIQTLNNEMADDEKINCVNEILKYIVKNGEMLYKTTHISLISSLSGINSADLELKYEKFMKTDDLDYNLSSLKPTNTQKIMIDNSSKLNLNSQKALDCIKNNFIILLDYLLIDNELLTKMNNQNLLINY